MMKSQHRERFEQETLPLLDDLYGVAMRFTRAPADADDLVQDTMARAYAAWDRFEHGSNVRAWLVRILVNGYIGDYRRARTRRRFAERTDDAPRRASYGEATRARADNPEGVLLASTLSDEVTRALDALPAGYREVVLLADIEGLSHRDIATRLRRPVGTIMSRLFRARARLRTLLAPWAQLEHGLG
ncbi:MAG: sigma-70 family RNA polymerase sigma factor [Myxococcales bacterium]|nr:sigma-70 family RNA polymerase sigma factor [Myxococcales bacterium]